jgi:hypothetical protein
MVYASYGICNEAPAGPSVSAAGVQQDRPVGPAAAGAVDGPADGGRQRDEDHLGALAADSQDAVAVFLAEVGDIGASGFEGPQAEQAEHGDEGEAAGVG